MKPRQLLPMIEECTARVSILKDYWRTKHLGVTFDTLDRLHTFLFEMHLHCGQEDRDQMRAVTRKVKESIKISQIAKARSKELTAYQLDELQQVREGLGFYLTMLLDFSMKE
jgi:hypothetical protein